MIDKKKTRQAQIADVFSTLCEYAKFSDVNLRGLVLTTKFENRKEFRVIMKKVLQNCKTRGFLNAILDQFPSLLIQISIHKYRTEHPFIYWYCMIMRPGVFYLDHFTKIENALEFYNILRELFMYYETIGEIPTNVDSKVFECFQRIFEIVNRY